MDIFAARSLPLLTRRSYVLEMGHILPWAVLVGLVEGQFGAIVVAKTFGGGSTLIALATASPIAALVTSLFWGSLSRGRRKVPFTCALCLGVALLAGTAGLIPERQGAALWFIGQLALAQVFLAGVITARAALWRNNYPQQERGRITARIQGARELVIVASSMAAAALCDRDPSSYRIVYPVAGAVGVSAILLLRRIHVRGERAALRRLSTEEGWRAAGGGDRDEGAWQALSPLRAVVRAWGVLRDDRRYAHYIVAQLCVGVSNLMTLAVATELIARNLVEAVERVGLFVGSSYLLATALIVAVPKLLLLASIGRWGRLFDRIGVVRFRVVNLACWLVSLGFGLAAVVLLQRIEHTAPQEGRGALLSVLLLLVLFLGRSVFFGLAAAGGKLAWNLGHLYFSQREDAEIYMGIHVSLTGLRGLVAPLVGVWLWAWIGWHLWVVAIIIAVISLVLFWLLARQERREIEDGGGGAGTPAG